MDDFLFYSIIYILFSLCVVFPPVEFMTSGFTITALFSGILGDEKFAFVAYHLRRTVLLLFVHSCLPWCKLSVRYVYLFFSLLLHNALRNLSLTI